VVVNGQFLIADHFHGDIDFLVARLRALVWCGSRFDFWRVWILDLNQSLSTAPGVTTLLSGMVKALRRFQITVVEWKAERSPSSRTRRASSRHF
jgi:hypothetical protein